MSLRKLTLSVEETVIERARHYSERHQTSISRLVSTFLDALASEQPPTGHTPAVRRLIGILPADADVQEHRDYLERKHGA
ncbi:MAG: DUF6364 family protein [Longimicrobiales bacterium]